MKVVATIGDIRREKLQLNGHQQQTNTQLFTGWMSFLSPSQQCRRTEGNHLPFRICKILILYHVTVLGMKIYVCTPNFIEIG